MSKLKSLYRSIFSKQTADPTNDADEVFPETKHVIEEYFNSYGKRYKQHYYGLQGRSIELTKRQGRPTGYYKYYKDGLVMRHIRWISEPIDCQGFINITKEEYIKLGGEV